MLHYQRHGRSEGPLIVFMHGFGEDGQVWNDFLRAFEPLHQILVPDLAGAGRSPLPTDFSIDAFADDLATLLRSLELPAGILVGHSMGGYIALSLAERYPEMVRGLCLFHSQPFADTEEKQQNRDKQIAFIEKMGVPLFAREFVPNLFASDFVANHESLIADMTEKMSACSTELITGCIRALRNRPDRSSFLKTVGFPVLFILGEQDKAVPHETGLRQVSLPSSAQVLSLPHVAHMGILEGACITQEALRVYVEGLEG